MTSELVLITAVIEAFEQYNVAVTYIPGVLISADMDKVLHMKLRGPLALTTVKCAPGFGDILVWENGQAVLYVRLLKTIYGCHYSALLFYNQLVVDLQSQGFVLNPYDPCVANKMVNGT